jgi:hypothetical protein
VWVHDASPLPLVQQVVASMRQSGRGLGLVAAVALRWGVEPRVDGKVVWAELASSR